MSVILVTIIGSAIILDKYAFGEFGVSQPLISGTIIGALFGDIQTGIFLGAVFQLIFLGGLPIGRDIPPDGQVAGIVGSGSYFLLQGSNGDGHALFAAALFALVAAVLGGAMEIITRRYNERLYHIFMHKENCLYLCHFLGIATAFLRGLCLFLPIFLISRLITIPSGFPQLQRELLIILGVSVGIANALYLFFKKSTIVYVILGGLCGLALLVF